MKEIPLSNGMVAMVDDEDYGWLSAYKWSVQRGGKPDYRPYASRSVCSDKRVSTISMHRAIMCAASGQVVDHINHNTLDNRRANLRLCTSSQNGHNRIQKSLPKSGYKGVYRSGRGWEVRLRVNQKLLYIGYFHEVGAAALAYNKAIIDAGLVEYATLNDVPEQVR